MKLNKIHYCCHFAFTRNMRVSEIDELAERLFKDELVNAKFKSAGAPLQLVKKEKHIIIGSERPNGHLSITIYKGELAFCFEKMEGYQPSENEIYEFVKSILDLLENDISIGGFMLKGVGVIDDLAGGYLGRVKGYFFAPGVAAKKEFSKVGFTEQTTLSEQELTLEYNFSGYTLRKAKVDILEISYRFVVPFMRIGIDSEKINAILTGAQTRDVFTELIEQLPDAELISQ